MRAVIVGGGLGGLAAALRLSARGWCVTVCESGPTFGGKMNRWQQAGYSFDTGPSLITMPHVFADLYAAVGERIEDHINFVRVDPHAEYRFSSGARIVCPASTDSWKSVIREVEPRDVEGFERIHTLGRKLYELSARTFFRRSPASRPSLSEIAALRFLPLRKGWGNYARTVESFFRSPLLRQIYNRYPTYVGSSPYLCPATLLVIPFLEREFGAWYIQGGLYAIVESLVGLARLRGITLMSASQVVAIEHENGRASAARLHDGMRIPADVVIMNGDAATTPALVGEPAPIDARSRSLSGFVLLFGTRQRPRNLGHHTVLFSRDYRAEFEDLFARREFPREPTIYVSAPAARDPSVAPAGGDAIFVMANAPAVSKSWTPRSVESASKLVNERLAREGLNPDCAEVRDIWHPGRFASRYLAPGGAIYGTDSHGWKNAFFRPPNRSGRIPGLYFVGGSTHPGGGTPTVLLSAKITSDLVVCDAG
jgi:phytoene desaturase